MLTNQVRTEDLRRRVLGVFARIGSADAEIMKLLDASAVSWAVVMTKADKLKQGALAKVCDATVKTVNRHVAAFPQLFVTSSEKGEGIAGLRAHLAGMALSKADSR